MTAAAVARCTGSDETFTLRAHISAILNGLAAPLGHGKQQLQNRQLFLISLVGSDVCRADGGKRVVSGH